MSYGVRRQFYKSREWQVCREAYLTKVGRLCEECMKAGRITPAVIVHHKVELTENNIDDPSITINPQNLEAVCVQCHNDIHEKRKTRYTVDELGRVTAV
jgi:5-methylcytosine-specific restriction endonuclease McrA